MKDYYNRTVCGIGFLGYGSYKVSINRIKTKQYETWSKMLKRCYSKFVLSKFPSYKGCKVCEEWHNFQVFSKWYEDNFYQIEEDRMELDKDILHKGNKIYSPTTCVFVNRKINALFTKANSIRGTCPIGVVFSKEKHKYMARCCLDNKYQYLGYFDTSFEAFLEYKKFKEKVISDIATKFVNYIPSELFIAMSNYQVNIND